MRSWGRTGNARGARETAKRGGDAETALGDGELASHRVAEAEGVFSQHHENGKNTQRCVRALSPATSQLTRSTHRVA
jgi:hypothetical protein